MAKAPNKVAAADSVEKPSKKKSGDEIDDLTSDLIKQLNKEFGQRVAYNLSEDEAPTIVKRWIDTGSIQLNYAIRNAANGGYPEGRIIEISGLPSSGKSHLAYHAAAVTQAQGGLVVYVDTENATPIEKLKHMGINVAKKFVYCDTHCTEEVFSIIESTITKAKQIIDKNVPILVIWDSVAATSPKAELDGDYDQNTIGLQARVISKGMRKITGVIGQNNVTLLCINQVREKIGVLHGDPITTPGGKAIPFHASVRIRLGSGSPIKDKAGNVIGIHTTVTLKKNKVAPPFRKCEFDIHFGRGIVEHEFIFDECRSWCDKNKVVMDISEAKGQTRKVEVCISGSGAWKELTVTDATTGEVILEKKFYKNDFGDLMKDPLYKPYIDKVIDDALTLQGGMPADDGESPDNDDDEGALNDD
jgi:recombination protein RecA